MSSPLYPRLHRVRGGRVVAGVAAGVSAHLGVDVKWVRVFFAAAAFVSGVGVILYAALWMFTKLESGVTVERDVWPRAAYALLVAVGCVGAAVSLSLVSGAGGAFTGVLGVVAVGAIVVWQAYDRGVSSRGSRAALGVGIFLVMGGVLAIALLGDRGGTAGTVVAVLASVFGSGLLVVPVIVRLATSLLEERQAKAAADQRAEIASRLHDSVLQTLALIQKRAGNAEEVARLARSQERELRAWLFDATGSASPAPTTVFSALVTAAGEVEDLYSVDIRPVTVGEDCPFTDETEPLVLAAREAMANAAKHAGVGQVDVYAEHLGGQLSVFVRDRGCGFDPQTVPDDRHGLRDSICSRMERAGGRAEVRTRPGEGTEVELTLG
ncbi:ATP-binding protein [Corynebacterium capitovis]|uniref:ATP-binding protein n=1 Tax=Corynebacterium capitovis TaxID=131081 RepID=UPI000476B4A3|nr:ATP-binding protein [Corynebacterium capitovis]